MTVVLDANGRQKIAPGLPVGAILPFYGTVMPDGWALCDGTGGTVDLTDRFIVGASSATVGIPGGVTSPWTNFLHTGGAAAAHSAHTPTQPSAHSNHVVTQPSNHSAHSPTQPGGHGTHTATGGHSHDSHNQIAGSAGLTAITAVPVTHASQGTHSHDAHPAHSGMAADAHSAHSGMTVDAHDAHSGFAVDAHSAHSVTQASAHATLKRIHLGYIQKMTP